MNSDLKIEDDVTSKIFNDSKLELTFCLNLRLNTCIYGIIILVETQDFSNMKFTMIFGE